MSAFWQGVFCASIGWMIILFLKNEAQLSRIHKMQQELDFLIATRGKKPPPSRDD